ncbi:MAG: DUF5715 family protein [Candidatus Krumholzibacteria bacterium]|jgi:hypothetical protein|nr:DUF5715 family protein [Candidatus Krumholzibacteria bacterium]MDP6668574.1 DUF5715 family protein [Candidatus Krumholzibacteria bacterium]MDP6796867.1 DUF5715 family protein [Candidatus Krumholzibacteria bacterium]MDP7021826.1 DUF5715 family protein [Candidatus Krumholzibacteria bacterium]
MAKKLLRLLILLLLLECLWVAATVWREVFSWPRADLRSLPEFTDERAKELRRHLNAAHLSLVADIPDVPDEATLDSLLASGVLKTIDSEIIGLRRVSYPFLRLSAIAEAERIAERFSRRLADIGISDGKLLVSSALRTSGFQKELQKENVNATRRSTHTTGLAFDLHYERYGPETASGEPWLPWRKWFWNEVERRRAPGKARKMKGLLAEILADEQARGRALVIYEREQPVFHVTVAP